MNDKNIHSTYLEEKHSTFFSKGKIKWEKTEAEVWAELSDKIVEKPSVREIVLIPGVLKYVAAAVLFFAVVLGAIAFFYQKTVVCNPGEHLTVQLPDESVVQLNAESGIKYNPLKWRFERKVFLRGEAFFKVETGKKFSVISPEGTTEVLGTSFNIYSRDEKYRVACLTGRVKVITYEKKSVVLEPGSKTELKKGELILQKNHNVENIISWTNNQFFFAGTPLREVIDEIERQYGVTIRIQKELDKRNFAGNFPKKYNVEEVLDFVCMAMQINFVKQSENVFLVMENS
ncbi:FecR family protein [Maribellus maritimus]|uniref:FecR family protein n=1 Tax=Maribellus maritimus TaxID=2870838 RepID=UPI001EEB5C60|nr:FecR domain-containing protein [Maribellus maritimus]MCG6188867.1 FecR domain-containing protein [Maribellus maritimus]